MLQQSHKHLLDKVFQINTRWRRPHGAADGRHHQAHGLLHELRPRGGIPVETGLQVHGLDGSVAHACRPVHTRVSTGLQA